MSAITEVNSNVVVLVQDSSVINISSPDTNITTDNTSTIVVEVPSTNTIVSGQPGPQGPAGTSGGEDEMVYAKQTDFVNEDTIYKGEAAPGSLPSAAVWRIRKLVLALDGDVSETWASGNANFDKIWDNRASLSYS